MSGFTWMCYSYTDFLSWQQCRVGMPSGHNYLLLTLLLTFPAHTPLSDLPSLRTYPENPFSNSVASLPFHQHSHVL